MLVCLNCRTQLLCSKSRIAIEDQNGVFPGNLYTCPCCSIKLLLCSDHATPDLYHRLCDTYIDLRVGVKTSKIDHSGDEV